MHPKEANNNLLCNFGRLALSFVEGSIIYKILQKHMQDVGLIQNMH